MVKLNALRQFVRLESAGGLALMAAAVFAVILENSPLASSYDLILETPVVVQVGALEIAKPLLLWINDGLMAIFFLLVGLEIKREVLEGELSNRQQIALPAIAAVGGMVAPAAIYAVINASEPATLRGWAIPAATDIAFALAVLSLLGPRVPIALKAFLTAVAIIDDIGAIVIIALFYSGDLSVLALVLAGIGIAALAVLNRAGVTKLGPYLLIGVIIWVCVLKSGVHATLAGIVVAFFIPMAGGGRQSAHGAHAPLRHLEHSLHPWVAFLVLPAFGFANAGVSLAGVDLQSLMAPVTLGIAAGLFVGKQIGVFGFSWVAVKAGAGSLPSGTTWPQLYGAALLTGIGFTMSLFIGSLAFEDAGVIIAGERAALEQVRLGVIAGSLLSGLAGYLVLRFYGRRTVEPVVARDSSAR